MESALKLYNSSFDGHKVFWFENTVDKKLFDSSRTGDLEGVVSALAQGGRVGVRGYKGATPLLGAAQGGHTDICGILLAHGSDVNEVQPKFEWTALHLAALRGHEAVVEALLSWGAIVDQQGFAGVTPLHGACQEGHLACVLALLKAVASISLAEDDGSLPIHKAARKNMVDIVRTLLDKGCSPDMVSSCESEFNNNDDILSPFS